MGFPSRERFEQRLGLLEVGRVKTLGEPAVDRRQELAGLGPFALSLPQPCQAHCSAQLQGLGLLAAGDVEGLVKTDFRLIAAPRGLLQQELSLSRYSSASQ